MEYLKHFETIAVRKENLESDSSRFTYFQLLEKNPNILELVKKACNMEEAEDGIATASGTNAVFTSLAALLNSGDHVLVLKSECKSIHEILSMILSRWKIEYTYVEFSQTEKWAKAVKKNTKMLFIVTPSIPNLEIIDLQWLKKFSEQYNLLLNVDNSLSTSYIQKPLQYGADIVIYSNTNYLDGQNKTNCGLILGRKDLVKDIEFFVNHTGQTISPFDSWLLTRSLETLHLRIEKQSENAYKLATYLENHPSVLKVKYPFLPSHPNYEIAKKQMKLGGGVISFEIKGGLDRTKKFFDSVENFLFSPDVGNVRTSVIYPPPSKLLNLESNLICISIGLEHIDDIIHELDSAFIKSE
jgi:O-succinylhomoserine sulfhydrylase